jgi:hypothetical protein
VPLVLVQSEHARRDACNERSRCFQAPVSDIETTAAGDKQGVGFDGEIHREECQYHCGACIETTHIQSEPQQFSLDVDVGSLRRGNLHKLLVVWHD